MCKIFIKFNKKLKNKMILHTNQILHTIYKIKKFNYLKDIPKIPEKMHVFYS